MEKKSEPIKTSYYREVISRHRWYLILPFFLAMIIGIILVIKLPKIYQAKTLILVQPPKVPESYVRPLISVEIEQRITTISQQIKSRTNLEKIIKRFKLFLEPKHRKWFMEDKIEDLRDRISVEVITVGQRDADAFSIYFKGKDPEKVMNITNTLARYFINENLKQREAQAVGTSNFLGDELKAMRGLLEEQEIKIKNFRKKNMGGLPEQLQTNLKILDRLQVQVNEKQENLRDAKNRLVALNNKLSEKPTLPQQVYIYPSGSAGDTEVEPVSKLQKLKQQLASLKSKYTDSHPDIIKLKIEVENLEEKIKGISLNSPEASADEYLMGQLPPFLAKQRRLQLQQRDEIELEIEKLEADSIDLANQISYYQRLVENTPKKEQQLQSIKRDYENIKKTYDSLLEKQMEAQVAVNMEKKQKGEQFRIIDPARIPTKPIEPKMDKLFLLSLMAGLGLGCGIIFILEQWDTTIRRPEHVESQIGIDVLALIPRVYHRKDILLKKMNQVLTFLSIGIAFLLVAGFGILAFTSVDQTIQTMPIFAKLKNLIDAFFLNIQAILEPIN